MFSTPLPIEIHRAAAAVLYSQNFKQQTAALLGVMHESSRAAAAALHEIHAGLDQQAAGLEGIAAQLTDVQARVCTSSW